MVNQFEQTGNNNSNTEAKRGTTELQGLPLGPDSLLWKYFDNRMAFVAATGIKQLMMREIDSGVDQHSKFFSEIVERIMRSIQQIGDTIFDKEHAAQVGVRIRDFHKDIKGMMPDGTRYHALHPKLWADTHITFMDGVYMVADRFDKHGLTDDEKEILWMEGITWYQQYGVSDRYLPADYEAYKERSDEMVEEYLFTDTARRALDYNVKDTIPKPNAVPQRVWKAMELPMKPMARVANAVIVSGLPEEVRERYRDGIPYSSLDRLTVFALEKTMQTVDWDKHVPAWVRYPKSSLDAFRREGRYRGVTDNLFVLGYELGERAVAKASETAKLIPRLN